MLACLVFECCGLKAPESPSTDSSRTTSPERSTCAVAQRIHRRRLNPSTRARPTASLTGGCHTSIELSNGQFDGVHRSIRCSFRRWAITALTSPKQTYSSRSAAMQDPDGKRHSASAASSVPKRCVRRTLLIDINSTHLICNYQTLCSCSVSLIPY